VVNLFDVAECSSLSPSLKVYFTLSIVFFMFFKIIVLQSTFHIDYCNHVRFAHWIIKGMLID